MRWSRHLLILLLLLGLVAAALCVLTGGPVWALLWSPWMVGCFLLRRGQVLGAVLLLLSAFALVATIWSADMRLYAHHHVLQLVVPSVVAICGALTALALLRRCLKVDRPATLALVLLAAGAGLASSAVFTSVPKVPACVGGPIDIGPLTFVWIWLNGQGHPASGVINGKEVFWHAGCHECPIDGNGTARSWSVDPDLVEDYHVRGRLLLRTSGQVQNHVRKGRWKSWHSNGTLAWSGNFQNGKASGRWTFRYDHDRRYAEGSYEDGAREGTWRCWWPNGQLRSMGRYCSDLPCGSWRYWNQHGVIRSNKQPSDEIDCYTNPDTAPPFF